MGLLSVISKLIDLSSSKREQQDSLQQIISENMETIRKKNMIQLGWSPLCERRAKIKRSMLHEIQTRSTIHIPSEGLIRGKNFIVKSLTLLSIQTSALPFRALFIRLQNSHPDIVESTQCITSFKNSLDKTSYITQIYICLNKCAISIILVITPHTHEPNVFA